MSVNRKKILFISPYFFPNIEWGGPVTVSWALARALESYGNKVEVLTTDVSYTKKKNNSGRIDGIKIVYAKSIFPSIAWKKRLFLSVDQIIKGVGLISEADLVHFHDVFIFQNIVLSVFCRLSKVPYVISTYGNLNFAKERSKSFTKKIFFFLVGNYYLKGANIIITNSLSERNQIKNDFPNFTSKIVYIPHIIRQQQFSDIDIKSKYNIPKSDLLILFMGRIYSLKGVKELLLGFLRYLRDDGKPTTLILAGPDAGVLSEIREIIDKSGVMGGKVILIGQVTGDLKLNLLSKSDIVCLLSKSETIPTVLVEAASFGKPIICSKECNLQSLIDFGGAVISTREPEKIAAIIRKICFSTYLRNKMGNKTKEWFNLNYDPKKIIKDYNDVYKETIARKKLKN